MKDFFQQIKRAVSDFKFYKEVKDFQISKSVKYLCLLVLLATVVLTAKYSFDFSRGLALAAEWAKTNLPIIEIRDGVVSADVKQPYRIEQEGFTMIIDTTGEVASLDEYEKGLLLTRNKLIYKEGGVKTESYDLSDVKSLTVDENFLNVLKKNAAWIFSPFIFIVTFAYLGIARFLQVALFSLVSLASSSVVGVRLNYKQLFSIGLYAITPSALLGAVLALFGKPLPFFGFLYACIYIAYLVQGIRACKE